MVSSGLIRFNNIVTTKHLEDAYHTIRKNTVHRKKLTIFELYYLENIYQIKEDLTYKAAREDFKCWLSSIYKININEANFLEYDHDINLGDFNNAKYFLFRDTTNNKLYLCVYTEAGEYFEDDLIAKSKEMDFSTKFKIDFYNKYNKDNI